MSGGPGTAYLRVDQISDRRQYELACAEAVRAEFLAPSIQPWLAETARRLIDVRLVGGHPDTELVVEIEDLRGLNSGRRKFSYELWGAAARMGQEAHLQPKPEFMASNIFMWVTEE